MPQPPMMAFDVPIALGYLFMEFDDFAVNARSRLSNLPSLPSTSIAYHLISHYRTRILDFQTSVPVSDSGVGRLFLLESRSSFGIGCPDNMVPNQVGLACPRGNKWAASDRH